MIVIVRVVAAAALAVVVMMVVMILGIDERLREPLLDGDRRLARGFRVLDGERHDLGAEPHVVDGAEVVAAQAALAIEEQQRRRALHAVGVHRQRQLGAVRLVDRNRESRCAPA